MRHDRRYRKLLYSLYQYCHITEAGGFWLTKGGGLQSSFEAQLAGAWLKWNPEKRAGAGEWWRFFPHFVWTATSSEPHCGNQSSALSYFHRDVCFPQPLLSASTWIWVNAHTRCPREGHRGSPDTWISYQSQSSHWSFLSTALAFRAKPVNVDQESAATKWVGLGWCSTLCYFSLPPPCWVPSTSLHMSVQ